MAREEVGFVNGISYSTEASERSYTGTTLGSLMTIAHRTTGKKLINQADVMKLEKQVPNNNNQALVYS